MKTRILMLALALLPALLFSQTTQTPEVTAKFFPDPVIETKVPGLVRDSGFTTYGEMRVFIDKIAAEHKNLVGIEIIGKSYSGRQIPMVKLSSGPGDKMRVLYFGRLHGNEPAGTEALLLFIERMTGDPSLAPLLGSIDFYVIPMVNPDGAERFRRQNDQDLDANRDFTKLVTPEINVLTAAFDKLHPHLAVDFHEFGSFKAVYKKLSEDRLVDPYDITFLRPTHPYTDPGIIAASKIIEDNNKDEMAKNGFTTHTYHTVDSNAQGELTIARGGLGIRGSSGMFSMKNAVAVLLETRIASPRTLSIRRRAYSDYLLAVRMGRTMMENEAYMRKVVAEANSKRPDDVVVSVRSTKTKTDLQLLNIRTAELEAHEVGLYDYSNSMVPNVVRKMPDFYYILPGERKARDIMAKLGFVFTKLDKPKTVEVEFYKVLSTKDSKPVGGITPNDVKVEIGKKKVKLPKGTLVFDTRQPYSRLLATMMEPEARSGLVQFLIIPAKTGDELPIYRQTLKK